MGTDVITGTDPYTHTIDGIETALPSYSMEANFLDTTNLSVYTYGTIADSLTVSGGEEDMLTFSVGLMAQQSVKNTGALSTIAAATTAPYLFHEATFTYFGSAVARVRDFSWTINNGGKMPAYHTDDETVFGYEYIPGPRSYTLETTVIPDDTTFFDQLKTAASNLTCTIKYVRGANDDVTITNSNCVLKEAPHDMPEELEAPVSLVLEPRTAQVVLTDSVSTQYDA